MKENNSTSVVRTDTYQAHFSVQDVVAALQAKFPEAFKNSPSMNDIFVHTAKGQDNFSRIAADRDVRDDFICIEVVRKTDEE